MIQTTSLRTAVFAVSLMLLLAAGALSQQDQWADRSYDVTLHLIVGSSDAGARAELPRELDPVLRQMKGKFDFGGYRLMSTFVGRVGEQGSFQYQSLADIDSKATQAVPTFLDWSIANLRHGATNGALKLQGFRLGAKLPVNSGSGSAAYENIGLNLMMVGLAENTPTLMGTLHLPGTSGTIFVIMTVRPTQS